MFADIGELRSIAKNIAFDVNSEVYSINEAIFEVMPFEYSLDDNEKAFVRNEIETLTGQQAQE